MLKRDKASVQYTDHAMNPKERCAGCVFFERIEPKHCSRVQGIIKPTGWCRLFEAKKPETK